MGTNYRRENVIDAPFNHLPKKIVDKACDLFVADPRRSIDYILNAFYVYRGCCCGLDAPHYLIDGAYEWPVPRYFDWDDPESVFLWGKTLHTPVNQVTISTIENGTVINKGIDGKVIDVEVLSNKHQLDRTFKYIIDDVNHIANLMSNIWQLHSLKTYINPLSHLSLDKNFDSVNLDEIHSSIKNINNIEWDD